MKQPKRGEIYFFDFSPSKGREIKGSHPALIIQNDVGNTVSSLTIVAAITSNLNGKLTIYLGTARRSIIPGRALGKEKELNPTHFPEAQINILTKLG